jgi:hypothetical protein
MQARADRAMLIVECPVEGGGAILADDDDKSVRVG